MSTLKEHQEVLLEILKEFDRICRIGNIPYMLFAGSALGAVRHEGFIPWDDDLDIVMVREDYNKFLEIAPNFLSEEYFVQPEFSEHWPMPATKLRKNNTTCIEKYYPKDMKIHQGIYIDIFPCDNLSNKRIVRVLQYVASRIVIAKSLNMRGYETNSVLKKIFMMVCKAIPIKPCHRVAVNGRCSKSKYVHTFFGGSCKYKKGIYQRCWIEEKEKMKFEGLDIPVSKHYDDLLKTMYGEYMIIPSEEERACKVHAIFVDINKNYTEYEGYRDNMKFDIYTRSIR